MENDVTTPLELMELLGKHPFSQALTEPQKQRMLPLCHAVDTAPGGYLLREGRPCENFFLLLDGLVSIELPRQGGQPLRLETQGPGTVIGWSWLYPPHLGAFDVRALEATRAIAVEASGMRHLMEGEPAFGYEVLKELLHTVVHRLQQSRLQLVDIHSTGGDRT